MTHIGYICFFDEKTHNGVLSDSNKEIHAFVSDKNYEQYQFVTYEGEGFCVTEVVPLVDYEVTDTYIFHKDKLVIQREGEGIFLYDKHTIKYKASGSEYFILNRYRLGKSLRPIEDFKDCKYSISEVHDRVDYVKKNKKKIADSYKVFIKSTQISKTGGDDRFYVDRTVSICYRDAYIDRFFLSDVELDRQSGYTSNFDSLYKDGEDTEEERRGRSYFLSHYNSAEHFSYLCDEYSKNEKIEHYNILKDNLLFLKYWGMGEYGFNDFPNVASYLYGAKKPMVDGNNKLTDFGVTIFNKYEKSKVGLVKVGESLEALREAFLREVLGNEAYEKLDKHS